MIKISNKKQLSNVELAIINKIIGNFYSKLDREFSNSDLSLNIKKLNKDGKRVMYEVHMRIDSPSKIISAKHEGWDLNRVMHRGVENLKNEILHRFKK